jgi:hypothetical protein
MLVAMVLGAIYLLPAVAAQAEGKGKVADQN